MKFTAGLSRIIMLEDVKGNFSLVNVFGVANRNESNPEFPALPSSTLNHKERKPRSESSCIEANGMNFIKLKSRALKHVFSCFSPNLHALAPVSCINHKK